MPEVFRRQPERQTGKDRHKVFRLHRFLKNLKEGRLRKIKGRRKNGEMGASGPANGQVRIYVI